MKKQQESAGEQEYKAYQLKAAVKNSKPPIWRRCIIPAGITFSQLSILLSSLMEAENEPDLDFGIEFYQRKIRFEEKNRRYFTKSGFFYDWAEASEHYIDSWLDTEEWFSFYYGDLLKLRVTVEKRMEHYKFQYPLILDVKAVAREEETEADLKQRILDLNQKWKTCYSVTYQEPEALTRAEILKEQENGIYGFRGSRKIDENAEKVHVSSKHMMKEFANILLRIADGDASDEEILGRVEKLRSYAAGGNQSAGDMGRQPGRGGEPADDVRRQPGSRLADGTSQAQAAGERVLNLDAAQSQDSVQMSESAGESWPEDYSRISLKEILMYSDKGTLKEMGKALRLHGCSSFNKEMLAEKIANELLREQVMKSAFLTLKDEEIQAWDKLMEVGGQEILDEEQQDALQEIYNRRYMILYRDGYAEIPAKVMEKYQKINQPEFQKLRSQVSWMMECLTVHSIFYGAAPVPVMRRMYQKRQGFPVTREEWLRIFDAVPEQEKQHVILDNWVVDERIFNHSIYQYLRLVREERDFYIPKVSMIQDVARHGYPAEEPCYQKLKAALAEKLSVQEDQIDSMLEHLCLAIAWNGSIEKLLDQIKDEMTFPVNQKKLKEIIPFLEQAQRNTGLVLKCGYSLEKLEKRQKMEQEDPPSGDSFFAFPPQGFPPHVLAASPVKTFENSGMIMGAKESEPEARTDAGTAGKTSKIYPNDPCPCGSGKKYKKCCGRK